MIAVLPAHLGFESESHVVILNRTGYASQCGVVCDGPKFGLGYKLLYCPAVGVLMMNSSLKPRIGVVVFLRYAKSLH